MLLEEGMIFLGEDGLVGDSGAFLGDFIKLNDFSRVLSC